MWDEASGGSSGLTAADPEIASALLRIAALGWQDPAAAVALAPEAAEDFGAFEGTPPKIVLQPDGRSARLLEPICYTRPDGSRWPVPKDAVLDGASIPRLFWTVIGGPFEGRYRDASIVHDHYCVVKSRTWRDTHRMFYEAMRCSGVSGAKAKIMYYAVYRFGPRWAEPGAPLVEAAVAERLDRASVVSFASDAEAISIHNLDLDEIEALADARNADAPPGPEAGVLEAGGGALDRARLLIVTGGGGGAEDLAAVTIEAARLPEFVLSCFEKKKIRIVACRSAVTDFETSLRGKTPRGWEGTGRTWDDVPGVYLPERKRVVIATVGDGAGRSVPSRASGLHGSACLTVHESLHGFDYIGGHAALAEARFVGARQNDFDRLGAYERQAAQAGLEETYAESGARFAAEAEAMRADWPHLHAYWEAQPSAAPEAAVSLEIAGERRAPPADIAEGAIGTAAFAEDGSLLLDLRAEDEGGAIGHALLRIPPEDPAHAVLRAELSAGPELAAAGGGAVLFRPGPARR